MRLSRYTDYALRVLMYLAVHTDRQCSINEIAQAHRISENHLMKVVHELGRAGFVTTQRGRGGGLKLARPADQIRVGEVVRQTEQGLDLLDCGPCVLVSACVLTGTLNEAMRAFIAVLDSRTIADMTAPGDRLRALLATSSAAP